MGQKGKEMKKEKNTFEAVIGREALYRACIYGKELARLLMEGDEEGFREYYDSLELGSYFFKAAMFAAMCNQKMYGWPFDGSVCLDATRDLMEIVGEQDAFRSDFRMYAYYDWQEEEAGDLLWTCKVRVRDESVDFI